ncbi:hypothetical protein ACH5RR_039816 [Cinchona calisaya]|uniref:Ribulose bisphosphate carboxylase large chain n=1 Tax=Cinchona calisaya TaxID=153742 RepID=A0ABD2Y0M4_9GENT
MVAAEFLLVHGQLCGPMDLAPLIITKGNAFGFKALRALLLEDLQIPTAYIKTFQGPPHGIQGDSLQILSRLIIAEIMVYFCTSTAQCMQLLTDRRIMGNLKGKETSPWALLIYCVMILLKKIEVVVFISLKIGSIYQFGGGTLGHPWGNAPGAIVNRVALEECVKARNEGLDLAAEGNEIIREASKWSPKLAAACEVWKAIRFNFKAVDTLDPS